MAGLARRCGVSRTDLLRMLQEGEEAGTLTLDGAGAVTILARLRHEANGLIARR